MLLLAGSLKVFSKVRSLKVFSKARGSTNEVGMGGRFPKCLNVRFTLNFPRVLTEGYFTPMVCQRTQP